MCEPKNPVAPVSNISFLFISSLTVFSITFVSRSLCIASKSLVFNDSDIEAFLLSNVSNSVNSLIDGYLYKSANVIFILCSNASVVSLIARSESPPISKKLSSGCIFSIPKTSLNIL